MTAHHPSKPLIISAEGRLLLFLSNFASCLCCLSSFKAKCLPWIWQHWVHILKMTAPLPIHLFQKVHKCLCFDATNTLEPKSLAHHLLKITLVFQITSLINSQSQDLKGERATIWVPIQPLKTSCPTTPSKNLSVSRLFTGLSQARSSLSIVKCVVLLEQTLPLSNKWF